MSKFLLLLLSLSIPTSWAIQPSAMMLIKKEAVPDDADLETFGAELVRRYDSIVNYRRPEMIAHDTQEVKFYDAASSIQKAYPKGFKYCAELIEGLGKALSEIQTTHEKDWEKMTVWLNKLIISEQLAYTKELVEKIRLYDEMVITLEKSVENCKAWKEIATRKRRRTTEDVSSDEGAEPKSCTMN